MELERQDEALDGITASVDRTTLTINKLYLLQLSLLVAKLVRKIITGQQSSIFKEVRPKMKVIKVSKVLLVQ